VGYKLLPSSEFFFLPSLFFLPKIDFGQWAQAVVFVGEDGGFGRGNRRWPVAPAPWSCATSSACFETKFSPANEKDKWVLKKVTDFCIEMGKLRLSSRWKAVWSRKTGILKPPDRDIV